MTLARQRGWGFAEEERYYFRRIKKQSECLTKLMKQYAPDKANPAIYPVCGKDHISLISEKLRVLRKMHHFSQEKLSEGICSVEYLSRLENGKRTASKKIVKRLMERLQYKLDRSDFYIHVKSYEMFELTRKLDQEITRQNFIKAEKILTELELIILPDSCINHQYILGNRSVLAYKMKQINEEEAIAKYHKALSFTISNLDSINLKEYPLSKNEMFLFFHIASVYMHSNRPKEAIQIMVSRKQYYEKKWMRTACFQLEYILILTNLSAWLGDVGEFEEAVRLCDLGIKICMNCGYAEAVPTLLLNKTINLQKNQRKAEHKKTKWEEAIQDTFYMSDLLKQEYVNACVSEYFTGAKNGETQWY